LFSKVLDDKKEIKYQDLKNIFLSSRNEQKQEEKEESNKKRRCEEAILSRESKTK
jgi:hypothetical protein